ncbi:MAG: hypothetical protein FWK01_00445 [Pantanalinema sp. GBBB05]|nr:hypothetical protein [Pantanalinema sp. GBBB05]
MVSPWCNPLPMEQYVAHRVVIYFYSGRWIPIQFCDLGDAIILYHRLWAAGHQLFVFPPHLNPALFETELEWIS